MRNKVRFMLHILAEPFDLEFMRLAAVASMLLGVLCGLVGTYVVLRKMSFLAGALCHTILPGIAFGYFQKLNIFACALCSGVLAALGISALSRHGRIREDAAIGVVFTAMFAAGIIYISSRQSFRDLTAVLFGNILAVTPSNIFLLVGLLLLTVLVLMAFHKEMTLATMDEDYARSIGLPVERIRLLIVVLTAVAVVAAIQAVGVVLTAALLITPAASASLLTKRLRTMMALSALLATLSALAGLYASWYADVPAGPAIVLCATIFFLLAWSWSAVRERGKKIRTA